jgi:hypothetical protein
MLIIYIILNILLSLTVIIPFYLLKIRVLVDLYILYICEKEMGSLSENGHF